MKLLKGIGTTLCLVVICLLVAPKMKANEQPNSGVVTFGVPVEVPGVGAQILPAGNYLFKALESTPDRDVIQISSPDGSHVFTTMLGVPNSRLKAPDLITVVFTDRPAADPLALKAWYCPGRTWGDTIVYEKPRAIQLAKESNEAVLSTSVVLANSSVEVLKTAAIEAVSPTGETVALTGIVDAPPTVAPALAVAAEPAVAASPNPTEVSTVAVGNTPAEKPAVVTDTTVAAVPAVAVVPPPAAVPAPVAVTQPLVTPTPTVTAEPVVVPTPVPVPVPVAVTEPAATPAPAIATAPEVATATLPKTASLLPLFGLVGLLMLGFGFLLSGLLKRRA